MKLRGRWHLICSSTRDAHDHHRGGCLFVVSEIVSGAAMGIFALNETIELRDSDLRSSPYPSPGQRPDFVQQRTYGDGLHQNLEDIAASRTLVECFAVVCSRHQENAAVWARLADGNCSLNPIDSTHTDVHKEAIGRSIGLSIFCSMGIQARLRILANCVRDFERGIRSESCALNGPSARACGFDALPLNVRKTERPRHGLNASDVALLRAQEHKYPRGNIGVICRLQNNFTCDGYH